MSKHLLSWLTIPFLLAWCLTSGFAEQRQRVKAFRDCANCPEMVMIPSGSFMIGSPRMEKDRKDDEGPRKKLHIRQFAVSKCDITRGEWANFVAAIKRDTVSGCAWTGRSDADADPLGS